MNKRDSERNHRRDVEHTQRLFKLATRHRRPIVRLVSTRIRNAINNGNTGGKYDIY